MDAILEEFQTDLNRLRRLADLLDAIRAFSISDNTEIGIQEGYLQLADGIFKNAKESAPDLVILTGTLLLYLGGRFEFFVRTEFEFLCRRVAIKCETFKNLPREMRENIITMTAKVIAEPRRYGHAEQGVKAFIKNLADILGEDAKLQEVNSECLSITDSNMRADVLEDLYSRIGAKGIWDKIAQQAKVMVFFDTGDAGEARKKAKVLLDSFMELRNKIAHPSVAIEWPDSSQVREYIDFFELLAVAISDITSLYEVALTTQRNVQPPTNRESEK